MYFDSFYETIGGSKAKIIVDEVAYLQLAVSVGLEMAVPRRRDAAHVFKMGVIFNFFEHHSFCVALPH